MLDFVLFLTDILLCAVFKQSLCWTRSWAKKQSWSQKKNEKASQRFYYGNYQLVYILITFALSQQLWKYFLCVCVQSLFKRVSFFPLHCIFRFTFISTCLQCSMSTFCVWNWCVTQKLLLYKLLTLRRTLIVDQAVLI